MTKKCILLVQSHEILLQALSDLLENQGYEVLRATNGKEALGAMGDVIPDLILSGIIMPEMDGYTFYQNLREHIEWAQIPFVFLTGLCEPEHVERAKALGVDDYVKKPFEVDELFVMVRSRLNAHQSSRE